MLRGREDYEDICLAVALEVEARADYNKVRARKRVIMRTAVAQELQISLDEADRLIESSGVLRYSAESKPKR